MRVALAQLNPKTADLAGNTDKIIRAIEQAREQGADLVVAPETAITGYCSCDRIESDEYVHENKRRLLHQIVPATRGVTVVMGFIDCPEEACEHPVPRYNAAAVIEDGKLAHVVHKRNLPRCRFFDETRYFTAGRESRPVAVTVQGRIVNLGVLICEDMWPDQYPGNPYEELAEQGAELVVAINASPFSSGKLASRLAAIRAHLGRAPLPFVYVNTVGVGDNLKNIIMFDGRSLLYGAGGRLLAQAAAFREDLLVAEINGEGAPVAEVEPVAKEEEIFQALVMGIRDYFEKTGHRQAVLGLSGGIDSSVTAVLAAEALGPENVLGITLPSRYSSSATQSDAARLAENLGIEFKVAPIEEDMEQLRRSHREAFGEMSRSVTAENYQARLRGLKLMALSNDTGRLLLSCGNKTELALGYCTLYGDMAGGLCVIGDLNKAEVYALASHINAMSGRAVISQSVLERAPSAELKDGQRDPFDYPVVAPLVDDLIRHRSVNELCDRFGAECLGERYPRGVYERYTVEAFRKLAEDMLRLYRQSAFKRAQTCPLLIVSDRAFGFDLRETIIH